MIEGLYLALVWPYTHTLTLQRKNGKSISETFVFAHFSLQWLKSRHMGYRDCGSILRPPARFIELFK